MKTYTDQMGRRVHLPAPPVRIISLVPSQTELLFALGLDEEVVGVTKFCIHPAEKVKTKTRVGGTKKFHFDRIEALRPDLIIGNKEENERAQIEALAEKYPVWMSDIYTLEDALDMIEKVGDLTGKSDRACALAADIKDRFDRLRPAAPPPTAAYFIWHKPDMVAGRDTFIHEMLLRAGFDNVFKDKARYPEVTPETLKARNPDVILLSSEPFPFSEKYIPYFCQLCPQSVIKIVDGELFSWYGSRLLHAPAYFDRLRKEISV
ncbi:MAG: cobalamin-binding protein [Bacteroidetes bacterium]|nr:MAG: cobalamin-binding protein [Bacteroidota bacterium]